MEASLQQSLFGHYEIFDKFKNLHLIKKFPNKIILSGEKGIGKCTLAYHLINYTLSSNEDYSYCLLYTSPSPRDLSTSRMPSSA